MPSHLYVDEPLLDRLRMQLLRLGLPLVLKPRDRLHGLVARTAPALLGIFLLLLAFDISSAVLQDLTPEQMMAPRSSRRWLWAAPRSSGCSPPWPGGC